MSPAPAVLVVAGHDPSPEHDVAGRPTGFAGVRADAEAVGDAAAHCLGRRAAVEVVPVVTAWTEQDAGSVRSLGARPASAWSAEAHAAVELLGPRLAAVKVGLLASAAHVDALVALVRALPRPRPPVVVDPVLASSSGTVFLDAIGRAALLARLLPTGIVLTPNLPEAAALTGGDARDGSRSARLRAARTLLARGAGAVVLKGGHGAEDPLLDLVLPAGGPPTWLAHPRLPGTRRGTGCRFASALATALALARPLPEAAALAATVVAARWPPPLRAP